MKAMARKGKNKRYTQKKRYRRRIGIGTIGLVGGISLCYLAVPTQAYKKDKTCEAGTIKLPISTVLVNGQYLIDQNVVDRDEILVYKDEPKVYVGTNEEGLQYGYDANIIADKLAHYDYSNNGEKIVFLTFDDGTSTTVTPKILEILKAYDVKATFFLLGSNIEKGGEQAQALVKQIFDEGNAIANHSYTHEYRILYPNRTLNLENFKADFEKNEDYIKEILGVDFTTRVLRCPGGYMSWDNMNQLDSYLLENDKVSIDWNALTKDAEGAKKDKDQLVQEAKNTSEGKEIVVLLMHDTYGKEATAEALPEIIEYYKANGYTFKTLI